MLSAAIFCHMKYESMFYKEFEIQLKRRPMARLDRQAKELIMGDVYLENYFGKIGVIDDNDFGKTEVSGAHLLQKKTTNFPL